MSQQGDLGVARTESLRRSTGINSVTGFGWTAISCVGCPQNSLSKTPKKSPDHLGVVVGVCLPPGILHVSRWDWKTCFANPADLLRGYFGFSLHQRRAPNSSSSPASPARKT